MKDCNSLYRNSSEITEETLRFYKKRIQGEKTMLMCTRQGCRKQLLIGGGVVLKTIEIPGESIKTPGV